jgi:16S rRNA (guanine527-N7)-methyltransferase
MRRPYEESMPFALPELSAEQLSAALLALSPRPLSERTLAALYAHYRELDRWNRRLSLIGPGTADEILSRHYGESLAALPLLPAGAATGLDLGSGAGFPGLVLAAACPGLAMTLVEARERKCRFLEAAARRASLPCHCLNVRVRLPLPADLPETFDVVTSRALKVAPEVLAALAERLTGRGCFLLWAGESDPPLPAGLRRADALPLPGSQRRRLLRIVRSPGP